VTRTKVAIIGSGNIGTDLMIKVQRLSKHLEMSAMVGIDPASEGLRRAQRLGVPTTAQGVQGLLDMPDFDDIAVVFDATSAAAHLDNARLLTPYGKKLVDLTPAAIGPFVVPAVNLDEHLESPNVNMVTCGGQATIPVVAAVAAATPVLYAEIVASIASKSAGPGTRANIDEFTETTAEALEVVGGAKGEGHHRAQSGGAAADYARHRALPDRRCRSRFRRKPDGGNGRCRRGIRARLPAQATRAVPAA
jgi:acetaldehyde dehydrogenase